MLRYLRPGHVVRSAHTTWLVDESWPVAAALSDAGSITVVDWQWPPRRADGAVGRTVLGDGIGVVVGDGDQLAWVRSDACVVTHVHGDVTLTAADADVAWLADQSPVSPGTPPEMTAPPLPPGRIVAMRRDGSKTVIEAPAPVRAIALRGADAWVTLAELPISHRTGFGWSHEYPTSTVQVARDRLLADGLETARPATGVVPSTAHRRSLVWLENDPDLILRYGERIGDLIWWVGAPRGRDRIDRQVLGVAHNPADGSPLVRVDLGRGIVGDAQPVGAQLWVTIARRRFLAVPHDSGVDVVAVSLSGDTRTVHPANSIDISRFAPALTRPSDEQIQSHIDELLHEFDNLESYWHSPDGTSRALSNGLSGAAVRVDGEWPNACVVVSFRHSRRPGLTLRQTYPLFDETGAPNRYPHAAVFLMENLDTSYLAPADEAVDGVLDT